MARRITVLQGEVWNMDFDPIVGHEQGGFHPALVVSSNEFNRLPFGLCAVAAITKVGRGTVFEVAMDPPEGGVDLRSFILAHQVRTVSLDRLRRRRGQVSLDTLDAVLAITQRMMARPTRSR